MVKPRHSTSKDKNHDAIVKALVAVGAEVVDLSKAGDSIPDLLVGYKGQLWLMEIKSPDHLRKNQPIPPPSNPLHAFYSRAVKQGQIDFFDKFKDYPTVIVVTDEVEALRALDLPSF